MTAIILAAGQGTRLRPLTDNTPKCLLGVGGETILYRQIDALVNYNVNKIIVVTGYKANLVKDYLHNHFSNVNIKIIKNEDYATTNNLYSWMLGLKYVNEPYLLLNGDVVFHPFILGKLITAKHSNALGVARKECVPEDMKVQVEGDRVIEIGKDLKNSVGEFMGLAKFSLYGKGFEGYLSLFPEGNWFEHAISKMLGGTFFEYIDITNYPSIEIDFKEDLDIAKQMFIWGMPDWEIGIRHGTDVNVKKAKKLLFDLLDILEKEKITYWLNWGLLLGAYRDKGFIPWDTDMDVTCHWEDRDKILNIVEPKMLELGCFIPSKEICYPEDRWFIRDMEKIELNFVEDCGDKYIYSPNRCSLGCPKAYIDKLDNIKFYGRKVKIPSNTKEYLRLSYGDDWNTPIRDKKPVSL